MSDLTYFTGIANFKAVVADTPTDVDNVDPDKVGLTGTVTFTPEIENGDLILATDFDPFPTGLYLAPILGCIDTDGFLKLGYVDVDGTVKPRLTPWGEYPYTPLRLVADTPVLELGSALWYRVTFSNMSYNGKFVSIKSFSFQAPNGDIEFDLIRNALPGPGVRATALTKLAPTGVRLDGDQLVFTFGGTDIDDPIPLEAIAATVEVGDVATGEPGSDVTVTNSGTALSAVLDFEIPRGDTGDAATVDVGTVTTGAPGTNVFVVNSGTTGAAVLDFTIPRGVDGEVTLNTTQTLTNKTISGASNTITNLPASATPDAARLVCKTATGGSGAENGTNTWAKLVTITPVLNGTCALLLGITTGTSFQSQTAILHVFAYGQNSPSDPLVGVQLLALPNSGYAFYADGFKLVNNGYGQPVELWIKKSDQYTDFSVTEISRSVAGTVTYNNGAAWQSAEPTGSAINTRSTGVTVSGVPVVTTTGVQDLTNKTLTSPTITNPTITGTKFISRSVATVTAPTALGSTAATDYVTFANLPAATYEDVSTAPGTVALLHCDGANASTTITDSGVLLSNWTAAGNAQISTAQSKFGGSSLYFDGTGDYITATADPSNFAFGTGDFTIEMWIRPADVSIARNFVDFRPLSTQGSQYIVLNINASAQPVLLNNGSTMITGPTLSVNTWYHFALTRAGGATRMWVDGVSYGSWDGNTTNYVCPSGRPFIGTRSDGGGGAEFVGHMDDIRITRAARYTAAFTPPTAPHPDPPAIKLPTAVGNSNRNTVNCIGPQPILLSNANGQTINGSSTYVVVQDESVDCVSTGSNWRLV